MDLDLAFSHKKRGKDPPLDTPADLLLLVSSLFLPSFIGRVSLLFSLFLTFPDSLFASIEAVEPKTQEELQASKRWHVSSSR